MSDAPGGPGVALLGFGTVGRAVARRLVAERARFAEAWGVAPELRVVASRNLDAKESSATSFLPETVVRTNDLAAAVAHPGVDIVVELLGGIEPARTLLLDAFARGRSAVTANKKLLAAHGEELAMAAAAGGCGLGIEASVAGGIPVLRTLREGFAGDRITALQGILNGTCNFVLTEMERTSRPYDEVLRDAQRFGYAEADPASDVEGEDAAYKLALLSRLAFGATVPVVAIRRHGISGLLPCDFVYARMLGRTPRQLAVARRTPDGGLVHSVRTHFVSKGHLLAKIEGPFNAVEVSLEAGGDFVLTGRGAGGDPTATAVVGDVVELARSGARPLVPPFGTAAALPFLPGAEADEVLPFALRFVVRDRPGILADIAGGLARWEINIDAVHQSPNEEKHALPFVVTLEPVAQGRLDAALGDLAKMPFHVAPPEAFPMTP